jgi:cellulose synthase operon protein C
MSSESVSEPAMAKLAYRCLQLAFERAAIEGERHRTANAQRLALDAMHAAESLGEWTKRLNSARLAGDAARGLKRFSIARALYREYALGDGSCDAARQVTTLDAEMQFDEHRVSAARDLLRSLKTCGSRPPAVDATPGGALAVADPGRRASQIDQIALVLEVDLAAAGADVRDRAAIAQDLSTARTAAPAGTSGALLLDYLAARLDLAGGAADAIDRLQTISRAARARVQSAQPGQALAHAVATAAATAAIAGAGARDQWREVTTIVAEANGIPVPSRCALIVAADDFRFVGVAIDRDGKLTGINAADVRPSADWLAPEPLRRHLRGCEVVDVLAMPSWTGIGALLDPAVPWRYVLGPHRDPAAVPARRVIVAEPVPPQALGLPALAPWTAPVPVGTTLVSGRAATPERVSAELRDATMIEIHAHTDRVVESDARVLALTGGTRGWALTAEAISKLALANAPVVVLADCAGAEPAPYRHAIWGLPSAFWSAGARAIVAPLTAIPDADAMPVFAKLATLLADGMPVATAVAKIRSDVLATDPVSWVRYLVVFE